MKPASDAELRSRLRAAGLRATLPRVAVLRRLTEAGSPVAHGEVADALAPLGFDRATVYRNLIDLTDAGFARRSDLGDHVWRFEAVRGEADHTPAAHPHFVCSECGTVACLPESAVAVRPARGAPRALRRKAAVEIQVRGVCDGCG